MSAVTDVTASSRTGSISSAPAAAGVSIGPVDQIPLGEGRAFAVHGQQVAVFRLRDGRVHAIGAVCPHRGGPIADGQTDGEIVLCPLHLNAFELATGCSTTGEAPLPRFPVELGDAGDVVVYPPDRAGTEQGVEIGEAPRDLPDQYPTSAVLDNDAPRPAEAADATRADHRPPDSQPPDRTPETRTA